MEASAAYSQYDTDSSVQECSFHGKMKWIWQCAFHFLIVLLCVFPVLNKLDAFEAAFPRQIDQFRHVFPDYNGNAHDILKLPLNRFAKLL